MKAAIDVTRYNPVHKEQWDRFVSDSKNGTFLFFRDYMDYHSDRFTDHSLMFHRKGSLAGLLPGSVKGDTLVSHGGLTFGGIISDFRMTVPLMLEVFGGLLRYLRENGLRKLVYKSIPYIYHLAPAEEDRYALFLNNARLTRTDVTSTIYMRNRIGFQERRQRCIKKAKRNRIEVSRSDNFDGFMAVLADVLKKKYDASPVHTPGEIARLAALFPQNIKIFTAEDGGRVLAGVVIFENRSIAHAQYIASGEEGRGKGALDLVFDFLINDYYRDKLYFDFGISNEMEGRRLNTGLIEHKEGFGARAVAHDFYELEIG